MPTVSRIEAIQITPVRFDTTGYCPCKDNEAEFFSVTYLGTEPSYGKGWFPAYDKEMRYKYSSRTHAEMKAADFAARYNVPRAWDTTKEQDNA